MAKKYWVFRTYQTGLETVFKEYQEITMRYLWEVGEKGAGSGNCWRHTSKVLNECGKTISRASVIFFLNEMVDNDILTYVERSGKGGYHRVYAPLFDETGFKEHLATKIIARLASEYPEETRKSIWKFQRGIS